MSDIKELYKVNNEVLSDAFERVVAEIHIRKQRDNLKTFMICGCEPGVGSTTVSINLAISMADSGWKTLLIDADMRKRAKHKRLTDGDEKGFADYLTGKAQLNEVVCKTNTDGLDYIASGASDASIMGMFCSTNAEKFLKEVKEKYDYIIFDMPSLSSAFDASVMAAQIDGTVLVTKQSTGTVKFIKEAKAKLTTAGANILGIVVNKVDASEYRRAVKNYDYFEKQQYFVRPKKARKA